MDHCGGGGGGEGEWLSRHVPSYFLLINANDESRDYLDKKMVLRKFEKSLATSEVLSCSIYAFCVNSTKNATMKQDCMYPLMVS